MSPFNIANYTPPQPEELSLSNSKRGVSIGYDSYSSFAYAEDITVFSSNII